MTVASVYLAEEHSGRHRYPCCPDASQETASGLFVKAAPRFRNFVTTLVNRKEGTVFVRCRRSGFCTTPPFPCLEQPQREEGAHQSVINPPYHDTKNFSKDGKGRRQARAADVGGRAKRVPEL